MMILPLTAQMEVETRHLVLGMVLKRIAKFGVTYDTDGDPQIMQREVETDFAKARGHDFMILVGIHDGSVIGHALAQQFHYFGRLYVSVIQIEVDDGAAFTDENGREGMEFFRGWAQELGAAGIRCAAVSPAHVRLMSKYGFKPQMTMMRWEGWQNGEGTANKQD